MRSKNVVESIGNTPLVEIARISPSKNVRIFAKLEGQNTGGSGSMKDRIAMYMIEAAERDGKLTKNKTWRKIQQSWYSPLMKSPWVMQKYFRKIKSYCYKI